MIQDSKIRLIGEQHYWYYFFITPYAKLFWIFLCKTGQVLKHTWKYCIFYLIATSLPLKKKICVTENQVTVALSLNKIMFQGGMSVIKSNMAANLEIDVISSNVKGHVFQKQAWRPIIFMFYFYFLAFYDSVCKK